MARRLLVALGVAGLLLAVSGFINAPGTDSYGPGRSSSSGSSRSGGGNGGGSGEPGLRRLARRLAEAVDDAGKPRGGRVEPSLLNACGSGLLNVRIEYRSSAGVVRRTRMATIAAGGRRTFSIRASWPSEGVITGAVEGAGSFSLGFQVAEDGAVLWPAAAAADAAAADGAASPPAREGVVEGGACAPGGSVLRGPTAAAALSATVKAAAAPAVAGQGGEVRPTSITVVEPNQIIVRPDTVYTYLAEPVDIFILANDNIPDPVGTSIKLFNSGSPRGQITLLSLEDDSGEEEDVFTGSDGDLWYWTGAVDGEIPSNLTAPPVVVDNEVYTFLRYSYLTYTPGPFILEGTVQFNYTVGGVLGLVTVVIQRRPGDSLNAANDYFRIGPEETEAVELPILFNDMGPTGLASYWLEQFPADDPDYKSFLTVEGFTQPTHGTVELVVEEETVSTFTYTVTDEIIDGAPRCLVDRFTYAISDPSWPANRPATATVFLNIFDDPPDWADVDPEEPPSYPFAVDDDFDGVSRSEIFVMSGLVTNDVTCAGAAKVLFAGSIDPAAGRLNRNGNTVVWYPPAAGVPEDIEYIEFEYQLALPYVSGDSNDGFDTDVGGDYTDNVPKLAQSNLATVTLWFGEGGGGDYGDYGGSSKAGDGAAPAPGSRRAARKAKRAERKAKRAERKAKRAELRGIKALKSADKDRLRVREENRGKKKREREQAP